MFEFKSFKFMPWVNKKKRKDDLKSYQMLKKNKLMYMEIMARRIADKAIQTPQKCGKYHI